MKTKSGFFLQLERIERKEKNLDEFTVKLKLKSLTHSWGDNISTSKSLTYVKKYIPKGKKLYYFKRLDWFSLRLLIQFCFIIRNCESRKL